MSREQFVLREILSQARHGFFSGVGYFKKFKVAQTLQVHPLV